MTGTGWAQPSASAAPCTSDTRQKKEGRCPSAQAECIEDAAEIHGINLTELLEALNK